MFKADCASQPASLHHKQRPISCKCPQKIAGLRCKWPLMCPHLALRAGLLPSCESHCVVVPHSAGMSRVSCLQTTTTMSERQWAASNAFTPESSCQSQTRICPEICAGVNAYAVSCCSSTCLPTQEPRAEESHANLGTRRSNHPPAILDIWCCAARKPHVLTPESGCVTALLQSQLSLSSAKPTANSEHVG